jgi:hypothetical protein
MEPIAIESVEAQQGFWNRRGVVETAVLLSLVVGSSLILLIFG